MRQLLYIPDGKFITIEVDGKQLSIQEYIHIRKNTYGSLSWTSSSPTEEQVISAIVSDKFSDYFYERHDLHPKFLTRQMFEVVDV